MGRALVRPLVIGVALAILCAFAVSGAATGRRAPRRSAEHEALQQIGMLVQALRNRDAATVRLILSELEGNKIETRDIDAFFADYAATSDHPLVLLTSPTIRVIDGAVVVDCVAHWRLAKKGGPRIRCKDRETFVFARTETNLELKHVRSTPQLLTHVAD